MVGTKLLKVYHLLHEKLTPFSVLKSGWEWSGKGKASFYFIVGKKELPHLEVRSGPPLKLKEFVEDFKRKNKDTFVKEGRIYATIKTRYPHLEEYVREVLRVDYVAERIAKVISMQVA